MSNEPVPLITYPPSLDCEVGRWLALRAGLPFVEEGHSLFRVAAVVKQYPLAAPNVPMLLLPDSPLSGARALFDYVEARAAPSQKLVPADAVGAATAEAAWQDYATSLGNQVRVWAYFHFLQSREAMLPVFLHALPWYEKPLVWLTFPLVRTGLASGLHLSQESADAALAACSKQFDCIETQLADGRPYLLGAKFSICDLLLAVNAAPLLLPEQYQGPLPDIATLPAAARQVISQMRNRPVGQYVLRVFREQRNRGATP